MAKLINVFIVFFLVFILVGYKEYSLDDDLNSNYDIVVGDETKEVVAVTFIPVNYDDARERYWGVEKGISLGFNREPSYPHHTITIAEYGLTRDFTPDNGNDININTYRFNEDTIVYVKYYGGFVNTKFCIPNGPTNKGSGMMFEHNTLFLNDLVYSLPTLENQYFESEWGQTLLREDLTPWVTQWGYTDIEGWYHDEELTQEIIVPYTMTSSDYGKCMWLKGSIEE